jgi:hypothetical protein
VVTVVDNKKKCADYDRLDTHKNWPAGLVLSPSAAERALAAPVAAGRQSAGDHDGERPEAGF